MSATRSVPARFHLSAPLAAACLALSLPPGAAAAAAAITLESGPIVLGQTESASLTVRTDEAPGDEEHPLRLAVNVGSFGEITRLGAGVYRALYVPPTTLYPQLALIAVWRETGPESPIEFLRLPLHGRTQLELSASRGSEVTVAIGPEQFGPVVVGKGGVVKVPIVVPPDIDEATVTARTPSGTSDERRVKIKVPPYNRLTAALVPHAISADAKGWARLEVFYASRDGRLPACATEIQVKPSVGRVELARARQGRCVYRYLPPEDHPAETAAFEVLLKRDESSSAHVELALRLPPADRILLRPPPEPIAADGRSTGVVSALVLDAAGMGLAGETLELTADGEKLPIVEEDANGSYRARFVAPRQYPPGGLVRFEAKLLSGAKRLRAVTNFQLVASGSPSEVSLELSPDPVPADGSATAKVALLVRDAAGLPLSGARLIALATHGNIGTLEERAPGRYEATYVAPPALPPDASFVKVVDPGGNFERRLPIPLRAPAGRLQLGLRAGLFHDLRERVGPRGGLDVWAPRVLNRVPLSLGLSALFGEVSQTVVNASGLSSESRARFVPIALRAATELYARRRLSLHVGAAALATVARFETSLLQARSYQVAPGALGFVSLGWAWGPGQALLDLSGSYAPVRARDYALDVGGLGLELGYRIGVF